MLFISPVMFDLLGNIPLTGNVGTWGLTSTAACAGAGDTERIPEEGDGVAIWDSRLTGEISPVDLEVAVLVLVLVAGVAEHAVADEAVAGIADHVVAWIAVAEKAYHVVAEIADRGNHHKDEEHEVHEVRSG